MTDGALDSYELFREGGVIIKLVEGALSNREIIDE